MLKKVLILFFGLIFLASGVYYLVRQPGIFKKSIVYNNNSSNNNFNPSQNNKNKDNIATTENLKIPWETLFLPNGNILITERPGSITILEKNTRQVINVEGVKHVGEGGLLGAAIHPNFNSNNYIYLYYTTESNNQLTNKLFRYKLNNNELSEEKLILDGIKGSSNHDGGRIAFSPDNYLYVTTGDAEDPNSAQSLTSLNGKILRINDDGTIPADNPFKNAIYSYGHRNPQGITWDPEGNLWSTEHGPSGSNTGWDELNLIEKGKNYGWPIIKGDETKEDMINPVIHSGKSTWAPASAVYYKGSILFGGLRGAALYDYDIEKKTIKENFKNAYGRIRNVAIDSEDNIYITTSNTDGRGQAKSNDDKLIPVIINRGEVVPEISQISEPPEAYKINLPKHYYQTFNNCGPATLSMVLNYYGEGTTQEELGRILRPYQNPQGDNDDKSVSLTEMASEAENRSYIALYKANGDINIIKQLTSNGIPLIVTTWLKSNEDVGHYRIVTGYDTNKKIIYQNDSYQGPNKEYGFNEFLGLWQPFNYQYLIIVPSEKTALVRNILGKDYDSNTNWKNALNRGINEENNNPQNPYPVFNQAVASYYLGQYSDTVTLYERVANKLPGKMLWYQLEPVQAYVKTNQYQKANSIIDTILNNGNRAYSELYILKGDILAAQNDKQSAKTQYETALLYNTNLKVAQTKLNSLN
jgi:aldose sugar dehydrogenase